MPCAFMQSRRGEKEKCVNVTEKKGTEKRKEEKGKEKKGLVQEVKGNAKAHMVKKSTNDDTKMKSKLIMMHHKTTMQLKLSSDQIKY